MYTKFGVRIKNKRNELHIRIEFGVRIYFLTHPLTQNPMATWVLCASKENEQYNTNTDRNKNKSSAKKKAEA